MPRTSSASVDAAVSAAAVPHCVVVTGPRGAGKTRWLQQCVHRLLEREPSARCAVVLGEEGRTRMENFGASHPAVAVKKLFLPCLCCPAIADLPGSVRALAESTRAGWLFLELPVVAAPGLLMDFDRGLHWPRSIVVCLTTAWARAQSHRMLSPFQSAILEEANDLITDPSEAEKAIDRLLSSGATRREPAATRLPAG